MRKSLGKDGEDLTDLEIIKVVDDVNKLLEQTKKLREPISKIIEELNKYAMDCIEGTVREGIEGRVDNLQVKLGKLKNSKEMEEHLRAYELDLAQALIYYFKNELENSSKHFKKAAKAAVKDASPMAIDTTLYYLIFNELGIYDEMKKCEAEAMVNLEKSI